LEYEFDAPASWNGGKTGDSSSHTAASQVAQFLWSRQLTCASTALESLADTGAEFGLLPIRRIGKTVQIRCGPAAVTGNEAYTLPLRSLRPQSRNRGKA